MKERLEKSPQTLDLDGTTLPPGTPAWISPELLADTAVTWGRYYGRQLTPDESLEILLAVGRMFDVLEQPP